MMTLKAHSLLPLAITALACSNTPPPAAPCSPAPAPESAEAAANSAASKPAIAPRKFSINRSEIIEMKSEETGRDYEILVAVPESYAKEPDRSYPVLYLLDGQWDFPLLHTLAGGLRYDKVIPDLFIVGITYGGENPDFNKHRMEDYTPIRSKEPWASEPLGGDGPKFLSFLEHKVLPAIESKYRIDSTQRLLSGSSAGGLFSLYALLERPELFQSVLALSPATGWANKWLFAREKEFRKAHPALKNRVWLSVGTDEWTEFTQNARDFFKQFKASNYEGITLRIYEVPGERHAGNKPEAFNRALHFAFEPWAATQKPD
jgi:predicted alpha/beta superfamily hydrolase